MIDVYNDFCAQHLGMELLKIIDYDKQLFLHNSIHLFYIIQRLTSYIYDKI